MNEPTAEMIREWSQVDFGTLGFPEGATPDPLQEVVDRSTAFFVEATGLVFDNADSITLAREPLVRQVVQRSVEIMAMQGAQDIVETVADFLLLSSFSAGSYSESRRSLADLKNLRFIHADPTLNGLFWSLLTPDKYAWWMAYFNGENEPAWEVTEMVWQGGSGLDGYGRSAVEAPWESGRW